MEVEHIQEGTSKPAVKVRRGHSGDLDAIGLLWLQLMEYHAVRDPRFRARENGLESFRELLATQVLRRRDNVLFVAEFEGRVVGFMVARVDSAGPIYEDSEFGYVSDACVDESARRLGVGRALYEASRAWFRTRGVSNVRVSVATANPLARAFWSDMGFQPFMERLWADLNDLG